MGRGGREEREKKSEKCVYMGGGDGRGRDKGRWERKREENCEEEREDWRKVMMIPFNVAGYFWTSLRAEVLFPGLAVLMHCARSLK